MGITTGEEGVVGLNSGEFIVEEVVEIAVEIVGDMVFFFGSEFLPRPLLDRSYLDSGGLCAVNR
jgi:hypothetical protein